MEGRRGILYVVATPIGNLGDLTDRARKVLTDVDLIAAEDTRETRHLLAYCGINTRLIAYHDHNESKAAARLIEFLESGLNLALVSDAGTPLISDPGYELVATARARGLEVVPIPGANAAICALCAAGLPSDRFLFLGFPPRTSAQRRAWFAPLAREQATLILYESGRRAIETLTDLGAILGPDRRVVVARELTKRFETFLSGSADELARRLATDAEQQLGELVILVEGNRSPQTADAAEQGRVLRVLAAELPLRQAAGLAAQLTGARKNDLYKLGLALGLAAGPPDQSAEPD
uniref:16S rRNA (cytidine(1402)-2'-O)-methyltransferase n=1 Tax=Lamprocystis purpurea TaxID=61598 RepID=UPI00058DA806|nr:16S rRNA (cytidine(1402)-2'-O)-methyltransferase [Lamprocystis purpurea]